MYMDLKRRGTGFHRLLRVTLLVLPALLGSSYVAADDEADALIERLGLRQQARPISKRADWRKPERIVVPAVGPVRMAQLQAVAGGARLLPASSPAEARALAETADVIIGYCDEALLRRAQRVTWIQWLFAGAEGCVAAMAAAERKPLLTNMQRIAAPQIAEHAVAMMLSLTRGLHRFALAQQEGVWRRRAVPEQDMWEIGGKTLLVAGLGGIGSEIAWRADALGMNVLATRASSRRGAGLR